MNLGRSSFDYTYDRAGNLATETVSRGFQGDHSDRLTGFRIQTGASEPSVRIRYVYDTSGMRVKK